MSGLPIGWESVPIGALCDLKNGRAFKPSEWSADGVPIVRIQNLNNKNNTYNFFNGTFDHRHHLKGGELLFAWSGTPGTSFGAHLWHGGEAVLNQHIFRVDFNNNFIRREFFRYAINQKLAELIDIAHGGVGLRHITKATFEKTKVVVPPLNEQKRIADKLDVLLKRVDECREKLDRVPVILKKFRQAVLAAATTGALTEGWREKNSDTAATLSKSLIAAHNAVGGHKAGNAAPPTDEVHDLTKDMFPLGWALHPLRDLVKPDKPITYGILKPGPELEDGVPYIRVADFPGDRISLGSIRKTSRTIDREFKRSKLSVGDILISIRGTVGRAIVIPAELDGANITQDSARLSLQLELNRDYVLWYLRSKLAQEKMKRCEKGVAVRGINIGDVRALQVPIPSRKEQDEIVKRVDGLFTYADRLEARYLAARKRVDQLTPALLAKAFRGELVEQDPNDEPASVLLERIRAERAQADAARNPAAKRTPRGTKKMKSAPPTPSEAPEGGKNVGPSIPQRLLAAMQSGREYARAEITAASGISDAEWSIAIRQLKEEGKIQQVGEKRGARYSLACD